MLNRKLLEVLSHLTPTEKKRLRQFLASPYFNQGSRADDVLRLFDYISKYGADEKNPALSKEKVFRLFFPKKKFLEKVKSPLDSLTTDLFALVRLFLSQQEHENHSSEVFEHLALAKFYRKFSYEERFWKSMETMRTLQEKAPRRDAQHFYTQFLIEAETQKFRGMFNAFEDDVNLIAVHHNLDLYYSILKLEYTCSLIYQKQEVAAEKFPSDPLMDLVMTLSETGEYLDIPINRIQRALAQHLQNVAEPLALESVEDLLGTYKSQIDPETFKNLKAYVRYLAMRAYRKSGNEAALRNTFHIYKDHLESGYFYMDGQIAFSTFRNLVVLGLKLGELNWVKEFLDKHSPEQICGTRYPVEVHSLNMAEYYFNLKEYDTALNTLVYRLYENPTISIAVDILIIKIYYETQNDLLDSRMKALDQKIRRSTLSRDAKERYYNFLKKLDKLVRYAWTPKHPKRLKLFEEIKNTEEIVAREWLLEKSG
jgi:arginine repressor